MATSSDPECPLPFVGRRWRGPRLAATLQAGWPAFISASCLHFPHPRPSPLPRQPPAQFPPEVAPLDLPAPFSQMSPFSRRDSGCQPVFWYLLTGPPHAWHCPGCPKQKRSQPLKSFDSIFVLLPFLSFNDIYYHLSRSLII